MKKHRQKIDTLSQVGGVRQMIWEGPLGLDSWSLLSMTEAPSWSCLESRAEISASKG